MSECSPSFDGARCGCCYEAKELRAVVAELRAQIQAVRDVCAAKVVISPQRGNADLHYVMGWDSCAVAVAQALDGAE